jgi:tryptophanase
MLGAAGLRNTGTSIVEPPGGQAAYIDAGRMLPHIPRDPFPGQSLAVELYIEGGIGAVELGSVAFSRIDPESGEARYPLLEFVRLAIPRRVTTQAHFDYVAEVVGRIVARKDSLPGCRFTYAPKLLWRFTARFEPE